MLQLRQHIYELQNVVCQFADGTKRRASNTDRKEHLIKSNRMNNNDQIKAKPPGSDFRQLFLHLGKVHQFDLAAPLCLGAKITVYKSKNIFSSAK